MRVLILALVGVSLWAQQEATLGARLAVDVRSRTIAINDVGVREYIDRLGAKLALVLPAHDYHFELMRNPFAGRTRAPITLPGGYVFVSAELILAARDEAEFAGMLAHSMAHVVNRDWARIARSGSRVQSSIPLVFVAIEDDNFALPPALIERQREAELDADGLAVKAMSAAGYDPSALVRYLERTQPPPRADRMTALRQAVNQLPSATYSETGDFQSIQDVVRLPTSNPTRPKPSLLRLP